MTIPKYIFIKKSENISERARGIQYSNRTVGIKCNIFTTCSVERILSSIYRSNLCGLRSSNEIDNHLVPVFFLLTPPYNLQEN